MEIIMEVFKITGWRDILRASQTCRTFFEIAQDRSIWLTFLREDSPTLVYRTILEAPIDGYTTHELKNIVLRKISRTLGWNSPRKPHERITPKGNFPVGDEGNVLLEGGRWLLTLGPNLIIYNPDYYGVILAYDLDSPRFSSTIIYKYTSPEHDMVPMTIVHAQVDRSQSCPAFTVVLRFGDKIFQMPRRFDVLRIEQKGRGPEAKLVTSKIKTLSCENFYGIMGDYAITSYLHPDDLYEKVEILDWRTPSSSEYSTSSLTLKIGAGVRFLLGNNVFAIEDYNKIAIYRIPEFRWTKPSQVSPSSEDLQQPIWSASLTSQVRHGPIINFSKPPYGPLATRLAFSRDDRIYGLVVPHDGRTPALYVLATVPVLSDMFRHFTLATIFIDKIYLHPRDAGWEASMLAIAWPEEVDLARPTGWVPPVLHFTDREFAGHHTSANRYDDLIDEVSGRIVTGSKYDNIDLPEGADGVEWSDIICWSVVDFFHPQFSPSSFKS